jgi:hypothetical protein
LWGRLIGGGGSVEGPIDGPMPGPMVDVSALCVPVRLQLDEKQQMYVLSQPLSLMNSPNLLVEINITLELIKRVFFRSCMTVPNDFLPLFTFGVFFLFFGFATGFVCVEEIYSCSGKVLEGRYYVCTCKCWVLVSL